MEGYFIEFASRAGEFLFRQRIASLPATVGRALSNDFIVDDPYVAAQHLRLAGDPAATGQLVVTDLGSRNGLFKAGRRVSEAVLRSGEAVSFGHTTLRLRHVDDEIAPERIDLFSSRVFSLPVALLLLGLAITTALISVPFEHFGDITAVMWMGAALGSLAMLLGWAAIWAVLGRVFAGRAQFVAHLAIAGWTFLAIDWGSLLCELLAFAFSAPALAQGRVLLIALAGIWALHRHLSLAQMRWPAVNLPLALVLMAIPGSFSGLENWKRDHRVLNTDKLNTLYDPALRITGDQSLESFIQGMTELRSRADAVRDTGKAHDALADEGDDDE